MDRVTDYIRFTMGFVGLGYIVLWPLTAHDSGIAALQASFVCGAWPLSLLEAICHPAHAFHLSPGLHLLGLMAAAGVTMQLALRVLRRLRRAKASDRGKPVAPPPLFRRTPPRLPLRPVKPRSHFGLRGLPH